MFNLHFTKLNNYYNRKMIKYDTLAEYDILSSTTSPVIFWENDGVNTSQIINKDISQVGDYCLVCDTQNNILSRWFIVDEEKLRNGQHKLSLHRDLLADYDSTIQDADIFVEKANVQIGDSAIFNQEDMSYNQIKKKEVLLKDASKCAWLVGYYDKTSVLSGQIIDDTKVDFTKDSLEDWEYSQYIDKGYLGVPSNVTLGMYARHSAIGGSPLYLYKLGTDGSFSATKKSSTFNTYPYFDKKLTKDAMSGMFDMDVVYSSLKDIAGYHNSIELSDFLTYDGKVIGYTEDNVVKYARISITSQSILIENNLSTATGLFSILSNNVTSSSLFVNNKTPNENTFIYTIEALSYSVTLIPLTIKTYSYNVTENRYHTLDQPYDIFAIPYGEVKVYDGHTSIFTTNKDVAIKIASQLLEQSSIKVYDIQLLPYAPLDIDYDYNIGTANEKEYSLVTYGNISCGIIFNIQRSTGTKDIELEIPVPTNNIDFKIMNETEFNRICSPNYASIFEFQPTHNMGVDRFNVDYTYKPYTPYIHIAPVFNSNGLFGGEYDDARGLVLNGNFSIPSTRDEFATYELQNKNYQTMFNREVENLKVQQNYERVNQATSAIGSALGAGVGAGLITGNAIAGVGIGIGSAIAGGVDYAMSEKLRNETLNYKSDMFGYQLGNIKALPDTLTNIGAFSANNKLFPVLEYYDCTDIEKTAIRNKIKYNGMKVGRIGKVSDFQYEEGCNYFKGKVIRIDVDDNYHIANEIANELNKGVYYEHTE